MGADKAAAQLHYSEHNLKGTKTVVLIHGAFASNAYWDLTVAHMPPIYHLLIPDLPGHGESSSIAPFSIQSATENIAQLIRDKAHNGTAHLVGHSLGAHVAIQLASNYPVLAKTVFVSGFAVFPKNSFTPVVPYAICTMVRLENSIPRSVLKWLMDGADLPRIDTSLVTTAMGREIVESLDKWPTLSSSMSARTMIVVASKGGIIPSGDNPQDAVKLRDLIREKTNAEEVSAVVHRKMRHPWNRQAPKLFAEAICAWFEGGELPLGFVDIDEQMASK